MNIMEYIYYSFLAGWCADAVGARLEFRKTTFTEKEAIDAMHFIGEKTNSINEGQFTDDSEMEISLLDALLEGKDDPYFPIERIAKKYIQWFKSKPFDIGLTTTLALFGAKTADHMSTNAFINNENSESNGSMMRCVPIAAFSISKPYETILEIAELDASLTHYSTVVKLSTGIYCCILSEILSKRLCQNELVVHLLLKDVENLCQRNETILKWFNNAISILNLNDYNAIINEGHVKHAFTMVIYFLKHIDHYTYEKAIMEVLKCGGDTDTNAKIVANLFGAYYGNCIPEYMMKPVLEFECTKSRVKFYKRPEKYGIKNGLKLVDELLKKYEAKQ